MQFWEQRFTNIYGAEKMEKLKTKIEFKYTAGEAETAYPVIVVAAGESRRMNGRDKLFLPLGGMPVIARTLTVLNSSPFVSRIILVVRKNNMLKIQQLISEYELNKLTDLVAGGNNRQESVCCGLQRLADNEKKALIHDGARPLVDDLVIGGVAQALEAYDAVICGIPVSDTVKRVGENNNVIETVDRSNLYCVQTPQGVNVERYLEICGKITVPSLYTDDAGIFEAAGVPVFVASGSRRNIKITLPSDIEFAELLLGRSSL